jgi:hypothetical protein
MQIIGDAAWGFQKNMTGTSAPEVQHQLNLRQHQHQNQRPNLSLKLLLPAKTAMLELGLKMVMSEQVVLKIKQKKFLVAVS